MLGTIEPVEVSTAAGTVAVHVLGAGRPTVLWHGLYVDGSSWGFVLPALLPGRRLLVVDGPGWGRSARRGSGVRTDVVADAAREVVATLSPNAAVDWVGVGWGGRVGLELTAHFPELVRSLVLAMADPRAMDTAERRRVRSRLRRLRIVGPVGSVGRSIVADQLSPASCVEPQTVGAVLDALLLTGRWHAARSVTRHDLERPDLTELLARVTAPTLLVAGDDASPWPAGTATLDASLSALAQVAIIPDCRAQVALDQPGALSRAVLKFWSDLG